ncbi:MAG TPA: hypothetical protein VMW22_09480 [Candidatus Desulfaltia sp.]|nr:hypothetical protein [Candidatus Desulfaltia sp.]
MVEAVSENKTEAPCCAGEAEETCCDAVTEAEATCCGETEKIVVPGRCC